MNISSPDREEQEIIDRVLAVGQEAVFKYWSDLDSARRTKLLRQLSGFDFNLLARLYREATSPDAQQAVQSKLEPADFYSLPKSEQEHAERQQLKALGEEHLRQGRVAAFLVAGGQGSRLGYEGPKGIFPISPVKQKSLFQLHAEKILAVSRRYEVTIPWFIMTSETNHAATLDFFAEHSYFGLNRKDVKFFPQEMIPALDEQGQLILDRKDRVFTSPNGHGGSLSALKKNGALSEMQTRGVNTIFYFQIDNVLVKMCDPVFIGLHLRKEAEMSAKVVEKVDPDEKLGILGKIDGRYGVIEYSDFTREEKHARNPDGSLKFNAGSIAIHLFNVDFVERENLRGLQLPWHIAHKKVPYLDSSGELAQPAVPNGYKFETFVFDALKDTERVSVMEVARTEEFSPVKNAKGSDSPKTAHRDMNNFFGRWLQAAGVSVPRDQDEQVTIDIEISPLFALEPEDLRDKVDSKLKIEEPLYLG